MRTLILMQLSPSPSSFNLFNLEHIYNTVIFVNTYRLGAMSWLRSAVNKAVEAGGNSNLSRTVRSYADSVVYQAGQAVVGGAKLLQDRIGARNFQSFKHAVKRLGEVSVSCRGVERVQMLRRWLVASKEIERFSGSAVDQVGIERNVGRFPISTESKDSPKKPIMVLYYDPDLSTGLMNFRDAFLQSQALEGVTLSSFLKFLRRKKYLYFLRYSVFCLFVCSQKDLSYWWERISCCHSEKHPELGESLLELRR